jgi:hypothetical protein
VAEELEENKLWDDHAVWEPLGIFHAESLASKDRMQLLASSRKEMKTWPTNADTIISLYKKRWPDDFRRAEEAGISTDEFTKPHGYTHLQQSCCPYAQIDPRANLDLVSNGDAPRCYRYAECCFLDWVLLIGPDWDHFVPLEPYSRRRKPRRLSKRVRFMFKNNTAHCYGLNKKRAC